mgnify:CR=1 FL=1
MFRLATDAAPKSTSKRRRAQTCVSERPKDHSCLTFHLPRFTHRKQALQGTGQRPREDDNSRRGTPQRLLESVRHHSSAVAPPPVHLLHSAATMDITQTLISAQSPGTCAFQKAWRRGVVLVWMHVLPFLGALTFTSPSSSFPRHSTHHHPRPQCPQPCLSLIHI